MRNRKGAIELSMSTIVIVVIAVIMLIMGFVLVRKIMCSAIGLTGDIDQRVRGEIDKIFGSAGGEIQCLGSEEAVKMIPGKTNYVICGVKASETAEYSATWTIHPDSSIDKTDIEDWIVSETWEKQIAPGEISYQKIMRINIPDTADEGTIVLDLQFEKDGKAIPSPTLDFAVARQGIISTAVC